METTPRKNIAKRSWVWKEFIETRNNSNKQLATCNYCGTSVEYNNGTNNMKNHLASHKIFKPTNADEIQSKPALKKFKTGFCEEQELNSKLAICFADCHIPLNIVENESFLDFFSVASPLYKIPSRASLRELICVEARAIKEKIRLKTQKCEHPSYCTDLWKSKARDYYLAVTLQIVDEDWHLWNLPIAFVPIFGPHTAEAVGNLIGDVLIPFLGKGFKPFAGVIDGGDVASIKFTSKKLDCTIKDNTCICHQLNNIIKRMLNDYLEADYLTNWRTFVARTHKSHPFNEIWEECCQQFYGAKKILQLDTPTRWSSTVMMLAKAVTVKLAVERMYHTTQAGDRMEHFEFVPNWGPAASEMWDLLDKVVELFLPTAEAIAILEGEKYVTQSLVLVQLCYLEKVALSIKTKYPSQLNPQLHVIANDLLEELNQLWDNLPVDSVIASILDPRTKWHDKIPAQEIKEALSLLKKEFMELVSKSNEVANEDDEMREEKSPFELMFEDLSSSSRKLSPLQVWKQEINVYQGLPRADYKSDPLFWWNVNSGHFCLYLLKDTWPSQLLKLVASDYSAFQRMT